MGGVGERDDTWYRRRLESIDDLVVVLRSDGTIEYANPAAERLIGVAPDEVVGRNCLDFVHPDDLPRALENLSYGVGARRVEVPVTFRLRGRHGWETFQVRGRGAAGDPDGVLMLVARETDGAELVDDLLDALATGADLAHVHTLVARQLVRRLWGNQVAVRYMDADGRAAVAHTGLPEPLVALLAGDGETPWRQALEFDEDVAVLDPSAMKPHVAEAVEAAGFGSVVAVPVGERGAGRACLVSFGPADLKPNLGFGVAIDRCRRLLRLVVQHGAHRDLLERSARTDPLTGIANRRRFVHQLDEVLGRLAAEPEMVVSVAFVDLDHFKPVNDRFGHVVGDRVLQRVAERLTHLVAPEGLAARIGGDEFALIALGRPAAVLAKAVRAVVSEPIPLESVGSVRVGASIGAIDAVPSDSSASIVEVVDTLCYRDKQLRRIRR